MASSHGLSLLPKISEDDKAPSSAFGRPSVSLLSAQQPILILSNEARQGNVQHTSDPSHFALTGVIRARDPANELDEPDAKRPCLVCNITTGSERAYERHLKSKTHARRSEEAGIPFVQSTRVECIYAECSATFTRVFDMKRHVKERHEGDQRPKKAPQRKAQINERQHTCRIEEHGRSQPDLGAVIELESPDLVEAGNPSGSAIDNTWDTAWTPEDPQYFLRGTTDDFLADCGDSDFVQETVADVGEDIFTNGPHAAFETLFDWYGTDWNFNSSSQLDAPDLPAGDQMNDEDEVMSLCVSLATDLSIGPPTPSQYLRSRYRAGLDLLSGVYGRVDLNKSELEASGASQRPLQRRRVRRLDRGELSQENSTSEQHAVDDCSIRHAKDSQRQMRGDDSPNMCYECKFRFSHEKDLQYHLSQACKQINPHCGFCTSHTCAGHHPLSSKDRTETQARVEFYRKIEIWGEAQFMRQVKARASAAGIIPDGYFNAETPSNSGVWSLAALRRMSPELTSLYSQGWYSEMDRSDPYAHAYRERRSRRKGLRERLVEYKTSYLVSEQRFRDAMEQMRDRDNQRKARALRLEVQREHDRRLKNDAKTQETRRRNEVTSRSLPNAVTTWVKM